MLNGIHGPNDKFLTDDYDLIYDRDRKRLRFDAVKLMHNQGTQHTEAEIVELRGLGVQHFTMRLWDSVPYAEDPHGYAEACIETVKRFAQVGILDYQVDNEPNISWHDMGAGPVDYQKWLAQVIEYLTQTPRMPAGVRWGFPPFSFGEEWRPYDWLGPLIDIAPLFDFLCVNSYWQSDRHGRSNILAGPMGDMRFGGNFEWYLDWQDDMPIQITEWANSIHEQKINDVAVFAPSLVDAFRREQYPIYVEWLASHPRVEAAYLFISRGATDRWGGFKFPVSVADAMAEVMDVTMGQSLHLGVGRGAI